MLREMKSKETDSTKYVLRELHVTSLVSIRVFQFLILYSLKRNRGAQFWGAGFPDFGVSGLGFRFGDDFKPHEKA